MKLLLIGFQKYDERMYPHLRSFIDLGSERCELSYFHFRERGYLVQIMRNQRSRIRAWLWAARAMYFTLADSLRLWRRRNDHDTIIAIDHYAYTFASKVLGNKRVVLWSHDVISHDSLIYDHPFVRAFMKSCSKALARNGRVIIQDEERLEMLKQSLHMGSQALDVMYMPVSLERTKIHERELSSLARPRLLQSGGIGAYRGSDKLLAHYQNNADSYRLYFHGTIFPEIRNQLAHSGIQPMVSARLVSPRLIYQLNDYCDVGFVCYEDEGNTNFYLIAHASGQLVEFLRIGMPVIVMGKNNLPHFVEEQGIGIGISDMSDMSQAIKTIARDYQRYSQNCTRCFEQYFDIGKYVPLVLEWL